MVVGRIRGRQRNSVIMDTRIYQQAPRGFAFVKAIHPQRLYIYRADLDFKMPAQYIQLDGSTPRIFGLNPAAICVGCLFKDDGRVFFWVGLNALGDDRAEFGHVIHETEERTPESAEKA